MSKLHCFKSHKLNREIVEHIIKTSYKWDLTLDKDIPNGFSIKDD